MSDITLSDDQQEALDKCLQWWNDLRRGKTFRRQFLLAGLAGTGKTTLVQHIIAALGVKRVQYLAPTGKAAARLRMKGCWNAVTIHRFAFVFVGEFEDEHTGEERLVFTAKGSPDERPQLIVVDEGSMPGEREAEALISFGIPMLVIGDHGQLEPVRAKAGFDLERADVRLEKIMRQANESNIIRAASFVRQGFTLPEREYDDVRVISGRPRPSHLKEWAGLDGSRQVIVGRNATRQRVNAHVREQLGFHGPLPQVGEKIICCFNDHNRGIMNGEQFIVEGLPTGHDDGDWEIRVRSLDDGRAALAKFNPICFLGSDDEDDERTAWKSVGAWDFGYAITCHKSQGSEWDDVMVIDEPVNGCNMSRWRYTAITRAAKYLEYYI